MENRTVRINLKNSKLPMKIIPGHFATNHSHINYYFDMTTIKTRQSEAMSAAATIAGMYMHNTIVDTIVCLEGTQVIGAYLAEQLSSSGIMSYNAHQTLYVVTPEYNSNSQMIFRDNIQPMIRGKNVILLMASVTTGLTLNKGMECIQYYGGVLQGISALFSAQKEVNGIHINSLFNTEELPEYQTFDYRNCPYCKRGIPIDALVNSYGYSKV